MALTLTLKTIITCTHTYGMRVKIIVLENNFIDETNERLGYKISDYLFKTGDICLSSSLNNRNYEIENNDFDKPIFNIDSNNILTKSEAIQKVKEIDIHISEFITQLKLYFGDKPSYTVTSNT